MKQGFTAVYAFKNLKIILCPRNHKNIMIPLERCYQIQNGKAFIYLPVSIKVHADPTYHLTLT